MLPKQLGLPNPEVLEVYLNINLSRGLSAHARLDNVVSELEKNKSRTHLH